LSLANATVQWTALSLGNIERDIETDLSKILADSKDGHILVPLAKATQQRIRQLTKEDLGMYEKLERTSNPSARVILYDDVLRQVIWLAARDTSLAGRVGLTCKGWYPTVWKNQLKLNPPSPEAALSLSKRKAIDPGIIQFIDLTFPNSTSSMMKEVNSTFVKRFIASPQVRSLRKLRICETSGQVLSPLDILAFPKSLEDFEYVICPHRIYGTGTITLPSLFSTVPCAAGFRRLYLDSRIENRLYFMTASPLDVAKACPNLEEFGILWAGRADLPNTVLIEVHKHLPRIRRIVVPVDVSCLSVRELEISYGCNFPDEGGIIKLGASALLEQGKAWVQSVIQQIGLPLASVICSRHASVFEMAIQHAYSPEMFQFCHGLGLPISLLGHNSAVACLLAGPFPRCIQPRYILKEPPPPKKLMDFVKGFFRHHGDAIDFEATTIRSSSAENLGKAEHALPLVPDRYSRVNLLQAALVSGNFEIFNFITKQTKDFFYDEFTPSDLLMAPKGRTNPIALVPCVLSDAPKALECLRNLISHAYFSKIAKTLMNQPDLDSNRFPAAMIVEFFPELMTMIGSPALFNYEKLVYFDLSPVLCRDQIRGLLMSKGWRLTGKHATYYEKDKPWHLSLMHSFWNYVNKSQK
jgi:hypothetical protein